MNKTENQPKATLPCKDQQSVDDKKNSELEESSSVGGPIFQALLTIIRSVQRNASRRCEEAINCIFEALPGLLGYPVEYLDKESVSKYLTLMINMHLAHANL